MPMWLRFSNSGEGSGSRWLMMFWPSGGCDGGFVPPPPPELRGAWAAAHRARHRARARNPGLARCGNDGGQEHRTDPERWPGPRGRSRPRKPPRGRRPAPTRPGSRSRSSAKKARASPPTDRLQGSGHTGPGRDRSTSPGPDRRARRPRRSGSSPRPFKRPRAAKVPVILLGHPIAGVASHSGSATTTPDVPR